MDEEQDFKEAEQNVIEAFLFIRRYPDLCVDLDKAIIKAYGEALKMDDVARKARAEREIAALKEKR